MADATSRAQVIVSAVDRVTAPVRRINDRIESIREPVRRVNQSVSRLGDATGVNRLANRFAHLGRRIRGVGQGLAVTTERLSRIGGAVGLAAGGAATAVGALTYQTAQSGEQALRTSRRLGVNIETLQELRHAGERYGVQQQALTDGLKELSMRADEFAATGKGPGAEAFKRLGLDRQTINSVKGDTEALFNLVQKRMTAIQDQAAKQRIVDEIFGGQGGEQMVEMLSAAEGRIKALRQEAQDLGLVFTEEQAERSANFMHTVQRLTGAFQGLGRAITLRVLPHLQPMLARIKELVVANRQLIANRVGEWAAWTGRMFRQLMDPASQIRERIRALVDRLQSAWAIFSSVSQIVGGPLNAALAALAGFTFGPLIVSTAALAGSLINVTGALVGVGIRAAPLVAGAVSKLATGMSALAARAIPAVIAGVRAMGVALMTTPIGWITAGIAAVAGAAYLIYRNWEPIADWFSGVWDSITGAVSRGISRVVDLLTIDLGPRGEAIVSTLTNGIRSVIKAPANAIEAALAWVRDLLPFSDARRGPLSDLTASGRALVQTLAGGISSAGDWLAQAVRSVVGGAADLVSSAWSGAKDLAVRLQTSQFGQAARRLQQRARDVAGFVAGTVGDMVARLATGDFTGAANVLTDRAASVGRSIAESLGVDVSVATDAATNALGQLRQSAGSAGRFVAGAVGDLSAKLSTGDFTGALTTLRSRAVTAGEEIGRRLNVAAGVATSAAEQAMSGLRTMAGQAAGYVAGALDLDAKVATQAAKAAVTGLQRSVSAVAERVADAVSWTASVGTSAAQSAISGLQGAAADIAGRIASLLDFDVEVATDAATNALGQLRQSAKSVANQIGSVLKSAMSSVASATSSAASWVGRQASAVAGAALSAAQSASDKAAGLAERVGGLFSGSNASSAPVQSARQAARPGRQASRAAESAIRVQPPAVRAPTVNVQPPRMPAPGSASRPAEPRPAGQPSRPAPTINRTTRRGGDVNVTFSPTINVDGGASQEDAERLRGVLQENMQWLARQIEARRDRENRSDLFDAP